MLEGRNFLVPDATFAIETAAFLVVLFVMTRWVLPRIRAAMRERQLAIAQAMSAAREAEERREVAEAEASEIRAAARREARRVKEQAWAWREALIADAKRAGSEEYRWRAGRAQREQQRQTELTQRRLRQQAQAAAATAIRAHLGGEVDEAGIAALVDEHFDSRESGTVFQIGQGAPAA